MSGRRRPAPLSIRLSDTERASLEARAGQQALSTYVKAVLFGSEAAPSRTVAAAPRADHRLLAQLIGMLGQSDLTVNLKRIARQAELGTLYCDDTLKHDLRNACLEVHGLRTLLMEALCRPVRDPSASARLAFKDASERRR